MALGAQDIETAQIANFLRGGFVGLRGEGGDGVQDGVPAASSITQLGLVLVLVLVLGRWVVAFFTKAPPNSRGIRYPLPSTLQAARP